MTTARERAREDAVGGNWPHNSPNNLIRLRAADAASDVWEPEPKALWVALQKAHEVRGWVGYLPPELADSLLRFEAWAKEAFE